MTGPGSEDLPHSLRAVLSCEPAALCQGQHSRAAEHLPSRAYCHQTSLQQSQTDIRWDAEHNHRRNQGPGPLLAKPRPWKSWKRDLHVAQLLALTGVFLTQFSQISIFPVATGLFSHNLLRGLKVSLGLMTSFILTPLPTPHTTRPSSPHISKGRGCCLRSLTAGPC